MRNKMAMIGVRRGEGSGGKGRDGKGKREVFSQAVPDHL